MSMQEPLGGAATRVSIRNFSKDATDLVRELEDFGWTFRRSNHGAVGRAPDGKTTTSISRNLRKSNHSYQKARAEFRRWLKIAHPELVDAAQTYVDDMVDARDEGSPVIAGILQERARARTVSQVEALKHTATTTAQTDTDTDTETDPNPESETPPDMSTATATAPAAAIRANGTGPLGNLIRTEPWVPKNPHRDTISRATKRVWSNGVVDFQCTEPGCLFTSTNPRSVTQHFGANHTRGAAKPHFTVLSPEADAVLTELREQLTASPEPVEAAEPTDAEYEADQTAGEIVVAIQRMVSAPLLAQIKTLTKERDDTQEALRQLQSDWDALRSLVSGH